MVVDFDTFKEHFVKVEECSHEWEKKKLVDTKYLGNLKIFVFQCKCKKCGKEEILEYW